MLGFEGELGERSRLSVTSHSQMAQNQLETQKPILLETWEPNPRNQIYFYS